MHSQAPLVSVLMPVCDPHPVHFRQAVESILRQTLSDFELLIVEDPSPRSAAALVAELKDPRIRHLVGRGKGSLVDSLNRGLAEAQAAWVARADADDVCAPERLEKQLAYAGANPEIDIIGSQIEIIDGAGALKGYRNYPVQHEAIVRGLARYNTLAHPTVFFKRDIVRNAGGYRRFFAEDYELWSRLAQTQIGFANHPDALVQYRVIPQGIRSAKLRQTLRGTLEVKRLYWREQMDFGGKLRMGMERALLWLPQRLVLSLFLLTQCGGGAPVERN